MTKLDVALWEVWQLDPVILVASVAIVVSVGVALESVRRPVERRDYLSLLRDSLIWDIITSRLKSSSSSTSVKGCDDYLLSSCVA